MKDKNTIIESLMIEAVNKIEGRDISGALEVLIELYKLDPVNPELWRLNSICYYRLGDFEQAQKCLQEAERYSEKSELIRDIQESLSDPVFKIWVNRYKEALKLVEQKNYKQASLWLHDLLTEHDEFVSVYQVLGLCYLAMDNKEQAKLVWEKGLSWDTTNSSLSKYLDFTDCQDEQEHEENLYEKPAVKKNRTSCRALVLPAVLVLLVTGSGFLLQAGFSTAQKYSHNHKINNSALITPHTNSDNEVAAVSSKHIMTEEDSNIETNKEADKYYKEEQEKQYFYTGYNAYLESNLPEAIFSLTQVVNINSGNYINREALYYLAMCHYLQQNYLSAEKYFRQCINLFPESNYYDDCLFYLACCYHCIDQNEAAQNMMSELKICAPDSGYLTSPIVDRIYSGERFSI